MIYKNMQICNRHVRAARTIRKADLVQKNWMFVLAETGFLRAKKVIQRSFVYMIYCNMYTNSYIRQKHAASFRTRHKRTYVYSDDHFSNEMMDAVYACHIFREGIRKKRNAFSSNPCFCERKPFLLCICFVCL